MASDGLGQHDERRDGRQPSSKRIEGGFTLIELSAVIVLIIVISTVVLRRFSALEPLKQNRELRRVLNVLELLHEDAVARGESYRLVIDLDEQYYTVRREVPAEDFEANSAPSAADKFRLESEKRRRAEQADENLPSVSEELKLEELREERPLDVVFFETMFRDPEEVTRLGVPVQFPSLGERQYLSSGLHFRDVTIAGKEIQSGRVFIRFSPRGASDFAVLHFEDGSQVFTAHINPVSGRVALYDREVNFDWLSGGS